MEVSFAPSFVRKYTTLPATLKAEIRERIDLFRNTKNHQMLQVHKLHGSLKEQYAFSVNYKVRIVFWYTKTQPKEAILLSIGDHDIYDR